MLGFSSLAERASMNQHQFVSEESTKIIPKAIRTLENRKQPFLEGTEHGLWMFMDVYGHQIVFGDLFFCSRPDLPLRADVLRELDRPSKKKQVLGDYPGDPYE